MEVIFNKRAKQIDALLTVRSCRSCKRFKKEKKSRNWNVVFKLLVYFYSGLLLMLKNVRYRAQLCDLLHVHYLIVFTAFKAEAFK